MDKKMQPISKQFLIRAGNVAVSSASARIQWPRQNKNKLLPAGRRRSQHLSLILMLAVTFLSLSAAAQASKEKDSILARVNGEPVTRAELERLLANPEARNHLQRELGLPKPADRDLELLAVRELIRQRLILQEAARRGFTVAGKDHDKALASLRRRFEDLKSFGAWMTERKLDDKSLNLTIREGMLSARARAALVEGVHVPEKQVEEYYDAHKEELKTEEVWIQIIVVKEKAAAKKIQAALGKGEDFGRLAQQQSLGSRAARGGDMGWVTAGTLWPPMRDAVSTLKPGEAIGPLERNAEFLIVRLHARRPGRAKTLAEARPEIESYLLSIRQLETIQAWLKEKEKKSKIEVYAREKRKTN